MTKKTNVTNPHLDKIAMRGTSRVPPPDPHSSMWVPDCVSLSLAEQAEDRQAGDPSGRPGAPPALPGLCPLPKGDIGRVPTWSSMETLAKHYYPELAHLRDTGPLADYPFRKGTCPGESLLWSSFTCVLYLALVCLLLVSIRGVKIPKCLGP